MDNVIADLIIRMKDGTELHLGEVEVKKRVSKDTKNELEDIVREKVRITEPINF